MNRHLQRLLGFALMPALSMLASLALLPMISSRYGSTGWTALALGQSIGAVVGVVVALAWPIIGGHQVATAATPHERRAIFRASIFSRAVIFVVCLPVAIGITVVTSPGLVVEAVMFMIGIAFNGFTASWFFSGIGRPGRLVVNEGVSRLVAYVVSIAGLQLGLGLWWYSAMMVVAGVAMVVLNWTFIMRGEPLLFRQSLRGAGATVREHAGGTLSRVAQAGFAYGGVTLFAVFAPGAIGVFSAADQMQKASGNALSVLPLTFVSWIGEARGVARIRRSALALGFLSAVSVAVFAVWLLFGGIVMDFLFSSAIRLTLLERSLVGGIVSAALLIRSFELMAMVPFGRVGKVYLANTIGSLGGIVCVVVGAVAYGTVGGLAGTLIAPVGGCLYYGAEILHGFRHSAARAAVARSVHIAQPEA